LEGHNFTSQFDLRSISCNFFKTMYKEEDKEDTLTQFRVIKDVPRIFTDEESDEVGKQVILEEVEESISRIPKDKSPGLNGWSQELFHHFFDIMGNDLLGDIEESRISGKVIRSLNATFVALIPKYLKPASFNDFKPIALCNFVYKFI
jgi:hypothetical protein